MVLFVMVALCFLHCHELHEAGATQRGAELQVPSQMSFHALLIWHALTAHHAAVSVQADLELEELKPEAHISK